MTYLVLARKYRPRNFSTLVGQEHVVKALRHALEKQRLHHAYLFTGTRGVGKTTIARIRRVPECRPMAGLPALQRGESGQVRKEAATATYCKCRGLGSPPYAWRLPRRGEESEGKAASLPSPPHGHSVLQTSNLHRRS